ncbi:MAG TPA: oligopeptide/dipeptide ABC transporter ATP-binding protein [Polyangia bacterium]|jgi:ABC-type dipeptide/oligopeptide/nickel transport system ATPase component|nr:oligopeptide/dipeptide ABC transporter ATP-binding protein [Polyangia bacterium]
MRAYLVRRVLLALLTMWAVSVLLFHPRCAKPLFLTPKHPYTAALLLAVPKPDRRQRVNRIVLRGEVADPANPPSGCYFHPRCA